MHSRLVTLVRKAAQVSPPEAPEAKALVVSNGVGQVDLSGYPLQTLLDAGGTGIAGWSIVPPERPRRARFWPPNWPGCRRPPIATERATALALLSPWQARATSTRRAMWFGP